jgi:hypothetical protein
LLISYGGGGRTVFQFAQNPRGVERIEVRSLRLIPIFEFRGFSLECGFQSVTTTRGHFSTSAYSSSSVSASVKASSVLESVFSNSGITTSASASMTASLQATGEIQTISNNIFALFLVPTYVYETKVIVKMSSGDVHEYCDGSYIQSNVQTICDPVRAKLLIGSTCH